MADNPLSKDPLIDNKCIFCKLSNSLSVDSRLLYEDDRFVIIADIRPVVDHHYLVITKNHIKSAKQLNTSDGIQMIKDMKTIGLEFMSGIGVDTRDQLRMGFHWPPFHAIPHIHLHLLYPISQMSFISRLVFRPGTYWFVEVDDAIEWLSKQ